MARDCQTEKLTNPENSKVNATTVVRGATRPMTVGIGKKIKIRGLRAGGVEMVGVPKILKSKQMLLWSSAQTWNAY